MSQYTSFIPPNTTPPEPPEAKTIAIIFSIFMSVLLILFIGFIGVDFLSDIAGYPLIGTAEVPQGFQLQLEQNIANQFELIAPQNHTQMIGPEVAVICKRRTPDRQEIIPNLLINDVQIPWEMQYGDDTWFACLKLDAGWHHLRVAESESEFFIETPDSSLRSPESWAWRFPHTEAKKFDRCEECHVMIEEPTDILLAGRSKTIGAWKGSASCFACHKTEDHETIHKEKKVLPPIDQCLQCHSIH